MNLQEEIQKIGEEKHLGIDIEKTLEIAIEAGPEIGVITHQQETMKEADQEEEIIEMRETEVSAEIEINHTEIKAEREEGMKIQKDLEDMMKRTIERMVQEKD